ncbi:MAG: acetyltransferase [Opitutales bacterium]|nr:acetyltransferase [Opitutales bacterium]
MESLIIVCEKPDAQNALELAADAGFGGAQTWLEEDVENCEIPAASLFCVAIKDAKKREKIADFLRKGGAKFASIIHPSCEISKFAKIGEGALVEPFCLVSANAKLGDFCVVQSHSLIGHNAEVGAFSNIGSHCDITGFCKIGEFCEIEDGAVLIPNVKIGAGVRVVANSAAIKSAKDFETIGGIPARKIGAGK